MCTAGFTFALLAIRRTSTAMTFCVRGFPAPSQSTRGPRKWRASRTRMPKFLPYAESDEIQQAVQRFARRIVPPRIVRMLNYPDPPSRP
jgi:hypothetical protein